MGGEFTNNLKKSTNIAVVANSKLGTESLCASIALSEIIYKFLEGSVDYLVSVYFLGDLPEKCSELAKKTTIYSKIGEKTLYLKFPITSVEKVTYNINEATKEFELGLVDYKGKKPLKSGLVIKEEEERIEMVVGVGFENESSIEADIPFTKKISNKFIFNKANLNGDTLVDGVMDLFLKEKVKPSNIASLAFATYYASI